MRLLLASLVFVAVLLWNRTVSAAITIVAASVIAYQASEVAISEGGSKAFTVGKVLCVSGLICMALYCVAVLSGWVHPVGDVLKDLGADISNREGELYDLGSLLLSFAAATLSLASLTEVKKRGKHAKRDLESL